MLGNGKKVSQGGKQMNKPGYEPLIVKEDGAWWHVSIWEGRLIKEFNPIRLIMDMGRPSIEIYINKHWYWYIGGVTAFLLPEDFPVQYIGELFRLGELQ